MMVSGDSLVTHWCLLGPAPRNDAIAAPFYKVARLLTALNVWVRDKIGSLCAV
jgi:hypothetical protein